MMSMHCYQFVKKSEFKVNNENEEKLIIQSENPIEQIWVHLSLWQSRVVARRMIKRRAERISVTLSTEVLNAKATGAAYCIRNAFNYWDTGVLDWSQRLLNSYYGLFWFIGALLIADPKTPYDLERLEATTAQGHGLGNVIDEDIDFPDSFKLFVKGDGFFVHWLRYEGIEPENYTVKSHLLYKSFSSEQQARLFSMGDILARIPEISSIYVTAYGKPPLSVHVFYSDRSFYEKTERNSELISRGTPMSSLPRPGFGDVWLGFKSVTNLEEEFIRDVLKLPLKDIQLYNASNDSNYWIGKIYVPSESHWGSELGVYHSANCPTSWIKPLLGTKFQPLTLLFACLYGASILVRYRPRLWREIREGELDASYAVLRAMEGAARRIVPQLIMDRLFDGKAHVAQPGSLFSLV
ncbi:MAG: hypothetical protein WC683_08430 [bacterium]